MARNKPDSGNPPDSGPLREGGVPGKIASRDEDRPDIPSKAARAQQHAVEVCRDLWGGNERVKAATQKYLPQGAGEDDRDYANRLKRSFLFNAYRRSVEGLAGLVFQRDPELGDDVPPPIVEHWENIDLCGTHGDVFARDRLQDALNDGHCAILVEFPATGGTQSAAEEKVIRPYWVPILKENILSWRTVNTNGRILLVQIVLRECTMVPDGDFGEREQTRYRMLYRDENGVVGFELLEVTSTKQVVVVSEGIYGNQEEIPIAEIITSGRRSMFESDPPLYDLACLNIAHYQQWSDAAWSRYKTNAPILFGAGFETPLNDDGTPRERAITVGANTAIFQPNPNASLQYVAHDGASLDNSEKALETLKSDMGTLGVSMLAPQKRAAETAEAKRLDKATSDSALSVTARGLQDGLERALGFHARYMLLPSGGSIEINRDFEGLAMDPAVMTAFASLIAQGLPWDIALDQLQKGGRVAEDVDVETMALEIATARAAQQEYEREQAQARLDANSGERAVA